MNNVVLIGRLTKDPTVSYTSGEQQMAIARFTVAVDRPKRKDSNESEADFISCVTFGKTAQFFEKYVKKGSKVGVRGRIQTGSYTNREGQKVYTTDVVVENAEFCDSKQTDSSAPQAPAQGTAQAAPAQAPQEAPNPFEGFMEIPDDDLGLPFN